MAESFAERILRDVGSSLEVANQDPNILMKDERFLDKYFVTRVVYSRPWEKSSITVSSLVGVVESEYEGVDLVLGEGKVRDCEYTLWFPADQAKNRTAVVLKYVSGHFTYYADQLLRDRQS